jgi:hypothetical protein
VIREIVEQRQLRGNHQAIAKLTITVAKLFNRGIHEREALLVEAHRAAESGPSGGQSESAAKL